MLRSLVAISAVFMAASPAFAAPLDSGRFAGSVFAGAEFPIDGDVHAGATAPIASLAALNPNLPAAGAELRIQSRSFDDIYGDGLSYGVEGAYGLGGGREVFGAVRRTEADQGSVQVGTAFVPALSASLPVFGTFGDLKITSIEGGVRQFFGTSAITPYVAGRAGVAFVDEIRATFTVPVPTGVGAEPNDINLNNVPFYGDTTTWTVGVDVGASWKINNSWSLMAETGLRYSGELDGDDAALSTLGLSAINDEGARLSVPLTVKARYAF